LLLSLIIVTAYFGSLRGGMLWMEGKRLWLTPEELDVGALEYGEHEAKVMITNFSDQPAHILGGRGACKCLSLMNLPMELQAGATAPLRILISVTDLSKSNSTDGVQRYVLFTDVIGSERIDGAVRWRQ